VQTDFVRDDFTNEGVLRLARFAGEQVDSFGKRSATNYSNSVPLPIASLGNFALNASMSVTCIDPPQLRPPAPARPCGASGAASAGEG
jgi:hypothetical protein